MVALRGRIVDVVVVVAFWDVVVVVAFGGVLVAVVFVVDLVVEFTDRIDDVFVCLHSRMPRRETLRTRVSCLSVVPRCIHKTFLTVGRLEIAHRH